MTGLLLDIRSAFRTLARSPWFAALAVATLALGIGGTTALFSLVDSVVLRTLPFKDPDRLVEIFGEQGARTSMRVPGAIVEALRERSATIEAIAIHGPTSGVLRARDGAVDVRGDRVSAEFVEVMGIAPLAGRGFLPDEERPGAPAVMLVSFDFWQQHLGGDKEAVGRTVFLDATPFTVVGIMPRRFRTQFRGPNSEYWTPSISERMRQFEREEGYELIARLAPRVTVEASRREAQTIAAGVKVQTWTSGGRVLGMHRIKDEILRDSAYALQLLLAAVAVVLTIACANLAQLLLARSDRRVNEFAIRKALGARSVRLFRLALLESLMLSAAGGVGGVVLAGWLVPAILTLAPSDIPRLSDAAIDGRVLVMAVGLSLLTGCAFGLAPALRLSRLSVVDAMKRRDTPRRARFRSALVVAQVGASVALFALAGLLGQTFLTLLPSHPGFEARSRTVFGVVVRPNLFPTPAERLQRIQELVRRLEALPGVSGVGLASNIPFSSDHLDTPVRGVDDPGGSDDSAVPRADVRAVSANLFDLLEMPLVRGRAFTSADGAASPRVAIVNQRLAHRLAPGGNVLGRTVQIGSAAAAPAYQIVGVVTDARSLGTSVDILNEVYVPYAQRMPTITYLILSSPLDSGALTASIRKEIHSVMPELPLRGDQRARPMEELVRRELAGPRFSATLMSAFSATALLLAAIGLFGLVAYSVSQRRRELGIRAALGARPRDLVMTTMRSAVTLTAIGIASGLMAGAYLTRFVESQLYAIRPLDLPTFGGAAIVMLIAAGLAAYVPARRAVRADPMTALRYE